MVVEFELFDVLLTNDDLKFVLVSVWMFVLCDVVLLWVGLVVCVFVWMFVV